jgi:DNA-binding NarL/FixJ family response regulator
MSRHLHLAADPDPETGTTIVSLPIRVLLAEDHALMRRSLRRLLDGEPEISVVAEAGDLATVAHEVPRLRPHVLVLDMRMPDGSSIELIDRLRRRVPRTEIVVLTMEESAGFARRALAAGAVGFVVKERADTDLPAAVHAAARGLCYVSPSIGASLGSPEAPLRAAGQ